MSGVDRSNSIYYLRDLARSLSSLAQYDNRYVEAGQTPILDMLKEAPVPISIDRSKIVDLTKWVDEKIIELSCETLLSDVSIQNSLMLGSLGMDLTTNNWGEKHVLENDELRVRLDPTNIYSNNGAYNYRILVKRPYGGFIYEGKFNTRLSDFYTNTADMISNCVKHMNNIFKDGTRDKQLLKFHEDTGYMIEAKVHYGYNSNFGIPFNRDIQSTRVTSGPDEKYVSMHSYEGRMGTFLIKVKKDMDEMVAKHNEVKTA